MKKKAKILCLVVSFFITITQVQAAGVKEKAKDKGKDKVIKEKVVFSDPSAAIIVDKSNPVFKIILQANPTTGYSWSLKNYDHNLIMPVKHKYYPPKGKKLLGAPGYEKWTFKVLPKGFFVSHMTIITLVYVRPWDGQGAQVTNFRVVTKKDAN